MKAFKIIATFALTLLLMTGVMFSTASAANWRNLTVYNNTGYTIYTLKITAREQSDWGSDLLGNNMLLNGGHTTIRYDANYQYYDIKIVLTDNSEHIWRGNNSLNFSGSSMLVFTYLGNGRFHARVD